MNESTRASHVRWNFRSKFIALLDKALELKKSSF